MQLKLGADPELFLSLDGKFISAAGMFPGTKKEPHKVEKGAIQVDGLALEFNIDPAETAEEFDKNIQIVLDQMTEMVHKVDKKIKLNFIPYADFDPKYFKSIPDEHKILGCDPDYMANSGAMKNPPDIFARPFRTTAGHVHIGWSKDEDPLGVAHFQDCKTVAAHFYYKNPFPAKTSEEIKRIGFYGSYGAFRPKSYGVELRQFSNLWVKESETRKRMFNSIVDGMKSLGA